MYLSRQVDEVSLVDAYSARSSDGLLPERISLGLATVIELSKLPEATPANLEWLKHSVRENFLGRLARSKEKVEPDPSLLSSEEERAAVLREFSAVVAARPGIEKKQELIGEHGRQLTVAAGKSEAAWSSKVYNLRVLQDLAALDVQSVLADMQRLPPDRHLDQ